MEISRTLSTDLGLLTDALNDPDVDLLAMVQKLGADTRTAVPSFLGLTLMISGAGTPHTFTALDPGAADDIVTSLLMPLMDGADELSRVVSVVLYAAVPGAFVDLMADLTWLTGIAAFALDEHLTPPATADGRATVQAESLVEQAVGVLMAGGLTPQAARRRLDALAADLGTHHRSAASIVLGETTADKERTPGT